MCEKIFYLRIHQPTLVYIFLSTSQNAEYRQQRVAMYTFLVPFIKTDEGKHFWSRQEVRKGVSSAV